MTKNIHVTKQRQDKEWRVIQEGNPTPLAHADTQREAFLIARNIAKDKKSDVIIHRPNGRFRERDSYGNDPHPPEG